MQKWSQSRREQWKNVERVMEKEKEWKEKIKGTEWSVGAGYTMGGKFERQEEGLGGLFGRGQIYNFSKKYFQNRKNIFKFNIYYIIFNYIYF